MQVVGRPATEIAAADRQSAEEFRWRSEWEASIPPHGARGLMLAPDTIGQTYWLLADSLCMRGFDLTKLAERPQQEALRRESLEIRENGQCSALA